MEPSDYGLSVELTERLAVWNRLWEQHFDSASGWTSDEVREQWANSGESIIRDLRSEVYRMADVVDEPWPLDS